MKIVKGYIVAGLVAVDDIWRDQILKKSCKPLS